MGESEGDSAILSRLERVEQFISHRLGRHSGADLVEVRRHESGAFVLSFLPHSVLDERSLQTIGEIFDRLIDEAPTPRLVVDFKQVGHLSSFALATLITLSNKIRARAGRLAFARVPDEVRALFSITKLDRLFSIHGTLDGAIEYVLRAK